MKHTLPIILAFAVAGETRAKSVLTASVTGTDILQYAESPAGQLTPAPDMPLVSLLQGTATAAGGNVELFHSSDTATYDPYDAGSAFATVAPTVLHVGFGSGQSADIRSLNGADWFTDSSGSYHTAYGADNAANVWFADFLQAMVDQGSPLVSTYITGNESALYSEFLSNGGFAQISDPNISYARLNGTDVTVGLAGFLDARPRLESLLDIDPGVLTYLFPTPFQVSEVAIIGDQLAYSFSAVDSGVVLNDGVDSYSGTYEVTVPGAAIPEPSGLALALAGTGLLLGRRRK